MKKILIALCCVIVCIGVLYGIRTSHTVSVVSYNTKEVMLGNTVYTLEIADTDLLREKGLSYRPSLDARTGMLFVFTVPSRLKFWMKDMNFPLDIIWLDADKKIVHIEHSLSPATYPQSFGPETPTQYVIEIPAGDTIKRGLVIGDMMSF